MENDKEFLLPDEQPDDRDDDNKLRSPYDHSESSTTDLRRPLLSSGLIRLLVAFDSCGGPPGVLRWSGDNDGNDETFQPSSNQASLL